MTKSKGFTLTEILIGISILAVIGLGIGTFQSQLFQRSAHSKVAATFSAKKASLIGAITSDSAWAKTTTLNSPSSHLDCIGSQTGCVGLSGPYEFALYDAAGNLIYNSSGTSGFNIDGSVCSARCDVELRLKWKPACSVSDLTCSNPLLQITGTFTTTLLASPIDFRKFSFQVNRSPLAGGPCTGAPLACAPGDKSVCTTTGWICVSPNPIYCTGLVSWNDAGTSYGPCSATVLAPGVLHDTISAPIPNTDITKLGAGTFLCIPGQPNNGFIVQPGATCTSAVVPIAGVCGPANTGTFVDSIAATAAGLCSAGTLSAPIAGAGPWSWQCMGISGGANSPMCSATQGAPPSCYTLMLPTTWQTPPPPFGGLYCNARAAAPIIVARGSTVTIDNDNGCSTGPANTGSLFLQTPMGGGCYGELSVTCPLVGAAIITEWCNTPVNGLCGRANGNTYPTAAAARAAGQCATGVASPSISGTGPWGWQCLGAGGGVDDSCTADDSTAACVAPRPGPRAQCCAGAWTSPPPAPPSPRGWWFCGCGNSPVWSPKSDAVGNPIPNGC